MTKTRHVVEVAHGVIERYYRLARFERHLGEAQLRPQEIYPRVDYDPSLIPGVLVLPQRLPCSSPL